VSAAPGTSALCSNLEHLRLTR